MRKLVEVMESYPRLVEAGLVPEREVGGDEYESARRVLLGCEVQVQAVRRWLEQSVPAAPSGRVGSYWVKGVAERALDDYVPNGVLIAAALLVGYRVTLPRDPLSPNVELGMDKAALRRLDGVN